MMELENVGHLFKEQETENFALCSKGGNCFIFDKNLKQKITYEDEKVIELYNKSLEGLDIKGNILIVGLGFGMLPYNFNKLNEVNNITVIEKSIDVINFVKPIMPFIEFIRSDAFDYETDRKWDTVFLDIYHRLTREYRVDQLRLIEKYSKMVNDNNIKYLKIHNIELNELKNNLEINTNN